MRAGAQIAAALALTLAACQVEALDPAPEPDAGAVPDALPDVGGARVLGTLAVLPDTQYYAASYPHIFFAQTGWIARNARRRNIPLVVQLGDVVDDNSPAQWQRAAQSMQVLDGVVPYQMVTGNHDLGPSGSAKSRETLLYEHFPYARAAAQPTFGGAFEAGRADNTFHLVDLAGRAFIVLGLEWGPRDAVITWADGVMAAHPDRLGILVTHAYLYSDGRRYDFHDPSMRWNPHHYGTPGSVNDGEELWQKLVRKHRFAFVLSGHVLNDGTGYLASVTDTGTICHQLLSNYQFRTMGGEGFLRLIEFLDDGHSVRVVTFSPLHDRHLFEPDQSFLLRLD